MGKMLKFDPYAVDKCYDPDEFYTLSTDGHGHKVTMYIAVKPDLAGEIAALVAGAKFPDYKTTGHFIRDAIVHRLHYIAERESDARLQRYLMQETHRARATALQEELDRCKGLVAQFEELAQNYKISGDVLGLERVKQQIVEAVEYLQEPWASKLVAIANTI
jgi:hypothetical protein